MKGNWFKLNRRIFSHPWLMQRTEWFTAWIAILGAADHKTGEVNLTEVYRSLKRHFNKDSWRHLVAKLSADGMIEVIKVDNLGSGAGKIQTARIINFFEYQAVPEEPKTARSQPTSQRAASAQPNADGDREDDAMTRSQPTSQRAANPSVLQEIQEVKEEQENTPPTPPSSEARFEERMNFLKTEAGQTLNRLLGGRIKQAEVFERAEFWAETIPPAEIDAAWKQARRDADRSPIKLFMLILDGEVALDKALLPPAPQSPQSGVQYGDTVHHPDYGEFIADFRALHEDAYWTPDHARCIPAHELTVVRRASN